MRFLAGVVVGIVVGRPVLNTVNKHLTPPVQRRIMRTLTSLTDRLNEYVQNQYFEEEETR